MKKLSRTANRIYTIVTRDPFVFACLVVAAAAVFVYAVIARGY